MQNLKTTASRQIYSVSQLTDNIKQILEDRFPIVWIAGEISNLKIPSSGHAYFTLKDNKAQISAVMFRGQMRQLKFQLDDGMALTALGRITVYEPRGNYQIILEYGEPQGVGALQIAFEQLKQKLHDEGLFSEEHKKQLPFLPQRIGIITSPTGAVVQDIIKVLSRRFFNLKLDIYPVKVQGVDAPDEVVNAIELANTLKRNDVLIIARGGGSLEDLAAFNNENVAYAIFNSKMPVISAIGHETDYTIADFVSDLRAPTPSAAAEIVVPVKVDLQAYVSDLKQRHIRYISNKHRELEQRLRQVNRLLVHPGKRIQDLRLHLDHLIDLLNQALNTAFKDQKLRLDNLRTRLLNNNPENKLQLFQSKLETLRLKLIQKIQKKQTNVTERFNTAHAVLCAVNPSAILKRGYAIALSVPDGKVVMDAKQLKKGQYLEIQLAKGKIDAIVEKITTDNSKKESSGA